jgi:hypothetical protein
VVKIRYAELPGGLHVRVVARGRDAIIYLLPGLNMDQRRAALRRARSTARMGHGPPLSGAGVAGAVVADRVLTTTRNAAFALRVHPVMFVPLIAILLSSAVAYFALTSASIRIHSPQVAVPQTVIAPPIDAAGTPSPGSQSRHVSQPRSSRLARHTPPAGHSRSPTPRPSGPSGGAHPSPSPSPSPLPGLPPGTTEPPAPEPSPSPSPFPMPSPTPSPTPCVQVGPLGLCLAL